MQTTSPSGDAEKRANAIESLTQVPEGFHSRREAERGLHADHVTVWRWVQRYAPELHRCLRRHLKPTNDSWRMDETYVRVKGKWRYLYRAVDSTGATQWNPRPGTSTPICLSPARTSRPPAPSR